LDFCPFFSRLIVQSEARKPRKGASAGKVRASAARFEIGGSAAQALADWQPSGAK